MEDNALVRVKVVCFLLKLSACCSKLKSPEEIKTLFADFLRSFVCSTLQKVSP